VLGGRLSFYVSGFSSAAPRAWLAHACKQAAPPSAEHQQHLRSTAASEPEIYDPRVATCDRPASQTYMSWPMVFPPANRLLGKRVLPRGTVGTGRNDAVEHRGFLGRGGTDTYR
jgi:hypothetical protein